MNPSEPAPRAAPVRVALPMQVRGFDLLRLPGLRRFVRWRYARATFQIPLLLLALWAIYDGLTGSQFAPRNLATTGVWLHYRGLIIIALAVIGNAFCAACPLMLTRGLSARLAPLLPWRLAWPAKLRNKALVLVLLVVYFLAYELFDLWASPWITAWLIVGYFGAALVVDTLFPAGTFCKHVCPLGNFNFAYATVSPTQITAVDPEVCRRCEHKPCLHGRETHENPSQHRQRAAFIPLSDITHPNGTGYFPGCETKLFVPTIQSNMDCTYCFNCVRACPYDNVALTVRPPGWELAQAPWQRKGKLGLILLAIGLAFWGLLNAIAMIGPYYDVAQFLAMTLATTSQALILGLLFVAITLGGLGITTLVAWLADRLGGANSTPAAALLRWGYVTLPLGFGFWGAHYLFHFLTGAASIVPVVEHFFWYRGADLTPSWRVAQLIPTAWLFPIGAAFVALYTLLAVYVTFRIALRDFGRLGVVAMWPVLLYVLTFSAASLWILAQPMEMRGTIFGPGSW